MGEPQINFDLERMKTSIESGTISLPRGMTHQQRRQFVRDHLKDNLPKGPSPEEIVRGLVHG
jgi:hypothetical protein